MTYTFKLSCTLPAPPEAVYAVAKATKRVGGAHSAWDGYIAGKTLELIPGRRIVQSWRTAKFGPDDPDSTITVELAPSKTGARLTLTHSGVPDGQTDYENGGWLNFYFVPMKAYFAREKPKKQRKSSRAPLMKGAR